MTFVPVSGQNQKGRRFEQEITMPAKISTFTYAFLEKSQLAVGEALKLKTQGAERIRIELKDDESWVKDFYTEIYNSLALGIYSILTDLETGPDQKLAGYLSRIGKGESLTGSEKRDMEERFMIEVVGIMHSSLGIEYGTNTHGFMSESIRTGEFDCDTSAFLVYDVAKMCGIKMEVIQVPPSEDEGHVLVKTDNFFFETTGGDYYPIEGLAKRYPWGRILEESQIQCISYKNRGSADNSIGDYEQAIEDFTRAIEIDPKSAGAYNNRGTAYYMMKDFRRAVDDCTEAIRLAPEFSSAHNNRGAFRLGMRKYRKAMEDFDKAIAINPKNEGAHNNRGAACYGLKKYKRAVKNFTKAIGIKPWYPEAYLNRGNAWMGLGEYGKAIEDYDVATAMRQGYADAYKNRGICYAKLGKNELAGIDFAVYEKLAKK
ncbi:Photosystem I assembly protein Ycf3 [Candidatus Gugararchaeum adminiculabundum]|nr:Photosystem I assembly protein Ycf3 [Candidatus Gugararchaeum adminiculabundum]